MNSPGSRPFRGSQVSCKASWLVASRASGRGPAFCLRAGPTRAGSAGGRWRYLCRGDRSGRTSSRHGGLVGCGHPRRAARGGRADARTRRVLLRHGAKDNGGGLRERHLHWRRHRRRNTGRRGRSPAIWPPGPRPPQRGYQSRGYWFPYAADAEVCQVHGAALAPVHTGALAKRLAISPLCCAPLPMG